MSRRAAVSMVAAVGVLVTVGVVSRGASLGAGDMTRLAAGAPASAPRDYWVSEFRRRWLVERRNGRARAGTVRALRRVLTVKAMRRREIAGVWVALANCESGGRWEYNGSSGFDGGLQFHPSTWAAYAPASYPGFAWQASPTQQVDVARRVFLEQGWAAWPRCSELLGLR